MDETPATQGLLKVASSETRQELAVRDAFPQRAIFTEQCKATYLAACNDVQAIAQRQRFLKSESYRVRILNIVSLFRRFPWPDTISDYEDFLAPSEAFANASRCS